MNAWLVRTVFLHLGLKLAVASFAADEEARLMTASIHLAALRGLVES